MKWSNLLVKNNPCSSKLSCLLCGYLFSAGPSGYMEFGFDLERQIRKIGAFMNKIMNPRKAEDENYKDLAVLYSGHYRTLRI